MSRKRFSALLLTIALIAAIVPVMGGCGEGVGDGKQGDGSKIVKRYLWYNMTQTEKARDAAFTAETGIKIEYVNVSWNDIGMKSVIDVAAKKPVDIAFLSNQQFPTYAVKGLLQPLDDLLPKDSKYWQHDSAMKAFLWNGKYYCAARSEPFLLWYNKTMFEKYDVKTPLEYYNEGNWTLDTLKEVGTKLTMDTTGGGNINQYGYATWLMDALVLANGSQLLDFTLNGNIKVNLTDPKVQKVLQMMQDGTGKWIMPNGQDSWIRDFAQGNLAMAVEAAFIKWNGELDNISFELDFAPMPVGWDNQEGLYPGRSNGSGIYANAPNPEGAIKYLEFAYKWGEENIDQSDAKKSFDEEQYKRLEMLQEKKIIATNYMGVASMYNSSRPFFDAILNNGTPLATAITEQTPVWQNEIDICLADNKLPAIEPFKAPAVVDFENGEMGVLKTTDLDGKNVGIAGSEIASSGDAVIAGKKSLKISTSADKQSQQMLFMTDPDQLFYPALHTYKLSFDYKLLGDIAGDSEFVVSLRNASNILSDKKAVSTQMFKVTADKKTGKIECEMTLIKAAGNLTICVLGKGIPEVAVDNVSVSAD